MNGCIFHLYFDRYSGSTVNSVSWNLSSPVSSIIGRTSFDHTERNLPWQSVFSCSFWVFPWSPTLVSTLCFQLINHRSLRICLRNRLQPVNYFLWRKEGQGRFRKFAYRFRVEFTYSNWWISTRRVVCRFCGSASFKRSRYRGYSERRSSATAFIKWWAYD